MMTDPISDMITRIRNAAQAGHATVRIPKSRLKASIARILQEEGFISEVGEEKDGTRTFLVLKLRCYQGRKNVIRGIERLSKSGGRRYLSKSKIFQVANGFGTLILSTPKGLMTGTAAKEAGIGGEALLSIW